MIKKYWVFILIALVISLGLAYFVSPFASQSPDGLEKVSEDTGADKKLENVESAWKHSPLPDYAIPGVKNEKVSTGLAGIIGTIAVFIAMFFISYLIYVLTRKRKKEDNVDKHSQLKILFLLSSIQVITFFSVHAQEIGEKDFELPAMPGPFTTWTAPLCGHRNYVFQPLLFLIDTRGTYDADGKYNSLPEGEKKSQLSLQFFNQYGLTENWELAWQLNSFYNTAKSGGDSEHSMDIGDSFIAVRYGFCGCEENLPAISWLMQMKFPLGKYENPEEGKLGTDLMGTGSYDVTTGFNFTKVIGQNLLHLDLLYTVPLKTEVDGIETEYGDIININLAGEFNLGAGFNYMLEFNAVFQGEKNLDGEMIEDSETYNLLLGTGIGWAGENWQALIGYQSTLDGKNTDAIDGIAASLIYTF